MRSRISMYSRIAILTITFFFTASLLFAEGTRTWEQSKYEDFVKGTAHGVAISSVGTLELAPGFKLVASTPSSAVWAAAGNLPAAGVASASPGSRKERHSLCCYESRRQDLQD